MTQVRSFPPIENRHARVLILGSMPGKASLRAGQYYAHPRNAFWPIMGELVGAAPSLPYEARIEKLKSAGIALWDVLAACVRDGSLDADIIESSIVANDFNTFLLTHADIRQVFFNGAMAEKCFLKHVRPVLAPTPLVFQRLPSTSPAHASKSYRQKLEAWEDKLKLSG
jgi:TDG/mug DNA glycosylase family protein